MSNINKFNIHINNIMLRGFVAIFEYESPKSTKNNIKELLELEFINEITKQDDIEYLGEREVASSIIYKALANSNISKFDIKFTYFKDDEFQDANYTNRTYIINKERDMRTEFGIYEKKNNKKMEILDIEDFCKKHKITSIEKNKVINNEELLSLQPAVLTSALGAIIDTSVSCFTETMDSGINTIELNKLKKSFNDKIKNILEMIREVEQFDNEEELLTILNKKEVQEMFKDDFFYDSNEESFEFKLPNDAKIKIKYFNDIIQYTNGEDLCIDFNNSFIVEGEKEYRLEIDEMLLSAECGFDDYDVEAEYYFDDRMSKGIEGIMMSKPKLKLKKRKF